MLLQVLRRSSETLVEVPTDMPELYGVFGTAQTASNRGHKLALVLSEERVLESSRCFSWFVLDKT